MTRSARPKTIAAFDQLARQPVPPVPLKSPMRPLSTFYHTDPLAGFFDCSDRSSNRSSSSRSRSRSNSGDWNSGDSSTLASSEVSIHHNTKHAKHRSDDSFLFADPDGRRSSNASWDERYATECDDTRGPRSKPQYRNSIFEFHDLIMDINREREVLDARQEMLRREAHGEAVTCYRNGRQLRRKERMASLMLLQRL